MEKIKNEIESSTSELNSSEKKSSNTDSLLNVAYSFLADLSLVWFFIVIYRIIPYYTSNLFEVTQNILFSLGVFFTFAGFPLYALMNEQHSKGLIFFKMISRVLPQMWLSLQSFSTEKILPMPSITKQEKVATLFLLVKIFYIPLMLNFAFSNYRNLVNIIQTYITVPTYSATGFDLNAIMNYIQAVFADFPNIWDPSNFNFYYYSLAIQLLFFIDTFFFCFGYLFEAEFLGNKVRSVEPTFFGWFVTLMCYPPFNDITGKYIPGYSNDYALFADSDFVNMLVRFGLLGLLIIYVWASVALGPKASNLTNRGIVDTGPYRFVRHPAYISKNLVWFITTFPVFGFASLLGSLGTAFIYYLRAITEERHLIQDPDYQAYCKKVKWRFIPFIY
ncbi:MAG: hypothetical protein OHK0017_09790 [Patescibacteria group bacterium]